MIACIQYHSQTMTEVAKPVQLTKCLTKHEKPVPAG